MRSLPLFLAGLFCLGLTSAYAQQNTATATGSVKGIVRDMVHNYVLKAATVSIYKADNTVINYQLSNNYGEFKFGNLPLGQPLRLDISNVGYELLRKTITIPKDKPLLDLKTLIINPKTENLKEVVVTIPPISYNNDTLEINAGAFKLDTNATVEDLLKKVPNITVWGDGIITVNGKEVKSLLVNGKQFFGGDNKVALQNIPKNALEKIQIFNTKNETNPLDSNLTANLKLKKGKDRNYFGKLSVGYGTNEHYQLDGNLNFSTPKLQLSIIGVTNDVNKTPRDVGTLLRNSTYKGTGTSIEYQPDFRQDGLNQGTVAGAKMTYNFRPESKDWDNKKLINADYYFKNLTTDRSTDNLSTTTIGQDNQNISQSTNLSINRSDLHRFNTSFNYYKKSHRFDISQSFNQETGDNQQTNLRSTTNNGQLTSTNNGNNSGSYGNKNLGLQLNYSYNNYMNWKQRVKNVYADYDFNYADNNNDRIETTLFRDLLNVANNRDFNRRYQTNGQTYNQTLNLGIRELKSLIFGQKNLSNFNAELGAELQSLNTKNNNNIADFASGNYQRNDYLSNNLQTDQFVATPKLTISKNFSKSLSNRYYKNFSIQASAANQFLAQDNQSVKRFQNIKRNYSNFLPSLMLNYSNYQYGSFQINGNLNYRETITVPNIDQLAPLTDSTNVYNLQRGNSNLREQRDRSISLTIYRYDMKNKNTLNFDINGAVGMIDNYIADSVFVDASNRRNIFKANADGNRYARVGGNVRKSLKLKTSELKFFYNANFNVSRTPNYLNNIFNFSTNTYIGNSLSVIYTYKDKFALEGKQEANTSASKQCAQYGLPQCGAQLHF